MVDGLMVTSLDPFHSPHLSRPWGFNGQPWSPHCQRCGLLCSAVTSLALSWYLPFRVVFSYYETVCTMAGTVLQGSCLEIVAWVSAGLSFSSLRQSPCWAPSLLADVVSPCAASRDFCLNWWFFVVHCCTGWASTSRDNL